MDKKLLALLCIPLLTLLPVMYGYMIAPDDQNFMGIYTGVGDANTYFDYMNQAKRGRFFFYNSYNSESTEALLIRPLYWLMGLVSIVFPSIIVWHLFRIGLSMVFIYLFYRFSGLFIEDMKQRYLATFIAGVGSGFGFFVLMFNSIFGTGLGSSDLWIIESIPFLSMNWAPHFMFSYCLMIGIFYLFIKGIENTKSMVYAGLLGLLLGFVHIYDVVTVYLVTGAYLLYLLNTQFDWQKAQSAAIFYIVSIPSALYYAYVFLFNPAFQSWTAQNELLSPGLLNFIAGFGIILPLALYGLWKNRKQTFLGFWLVLNLLLLYIPVSIQRRFVEGIFIPMAILSVIGLYEIKKRIRLPYLEMALIALILPTTVFSFINYFDYQESTFHPVPYFLEKETTEAIDWMRMNTDPEDVVLAGPAISNYIPRLSGNRVYVGHWAQTKNFEQKKREVPSILKGQLPVPPDVDYVLCDCELEYTAVYDKGMTIYEVTG